MGPCGCYGALRGTSGHYRGCGVCRCRGPRGASRVLGLELHPEGRELFVAFSGCIVRLPLSRCTRHGQCRRSCLAARDPYCVWLPPGGCVPFSEDLPDGFEQDVEGSSGLTGTCPGEGTLGDIWGCGVMGGCRWHQGGQLGTWGT
ncbi:semaphorin-6C-like, partial [Meleagris gallopavo]|uniref:semaphorin-6C-like n=1 Tax=Meleagris gallopavo TaxID=9103 RepID=UPI00093D8A02